MTTKAKETKPGIPISQLRIPLELKEQVEAKYPHNKNFTQLVIMALTQFVEGK